MFFSKDGKSEEKAERLYRRYHALMYTTAFSVLQDAHLTEDAVQQAFLKVIRHLDRIDEENEAMTKSFLMIISRNEAITLIKKSRDFLCQPEVECQETADPLNLVINGESLQAVIESILELKPIYRDVIFLRYSQDLTAEEIARILNITPENVRKRLQRARELVRESLEITERRGME